MMERRILKDFQIGIVETIVNEAVRGSSEVRDVFSTIAKAMNKKQSKKYDVCDNWAKKNSNDISYQFV